MLKEELRQIVLQQSEQLSSFNYGTERASLKETDILPGIALIVSGPRRSGKSTFLQQLRKRIPNSHYFNFDEPKTAGFEVEDFERLEEVFSEEFGKSDYYFFDEIQNVNKWELYIRKLSDAKKKVVITGSNASLLSRELGTRLTGRHLRQNIFPFSFEEFLALEKKTPSASTFGEYLEKGGFPEYLTLKKTSLLQEMLNNVLARDIVVRHELRESETIKEMTVYLLSNVGKEFSYNSLKKTFELGSVNTAIAFVSYLEDSYLIFTVKRFDYSLKKRIVAPKKVYSIDNGLASANTASFSKDKGRMLENAVFLHLRRKNEQVFYFKEKGECDFVFKEKEKIAGAIQACYSLTQDNLKREVSGLVEALKKFKLKKGLIITYNQEDRLEEEGKEMIVKPAWKWMTEKQGS
ncbi:MAG: ATP-binding protein [Candidatus Diapherotrites archaeon]|uniref:ATP-binding protein n=1 Tax=Candidatus Iainarchaeum sp. TaxID=3101447 RepID=A0A939C6V0_9ARCH|nr:ATP-binding protein [Candidatus Diapherotrites archaeon]